MFLHVIGTDPEHDVAVFGYGVSGVVRLRPADIPFVTIFPGVPFAFASVVQGSDNEITVYEAPLDTLGKVQFALASSLRRGRWHYRHGGSGR